jgi:hypothetical protein
MSEENKKDKKFIKVAIVSVGIILIGGGLGPLMLDLLDEDVSKEESVPLAINEQSDNTQLSIQPAPVAIEKTDSKSTSTENQVNKDNPENVDKKVLPALHESDQLLLTDVIPNNGKTLFIKTDIINNVVVFIDNFARGHLASNFSPLTTPVESFTVIKQHGNLIIDDSSYHRYDSYANAIDAFDVHTFIDNYVYLTPLIDQAYQEVGYPKGTFTDTFEKAINIVLDTPILNYDIELTSPSAMYEFKDENLESLPNTQKLMLRMGPDNLQKIQNKLSDVLNELQNL